MEPTAERSDDFPGRRTGQLVIGAAMEPTAERSDDGSRNLSRLNCEYVERCERSATEVRFVLLDSVVKMRKRPLTSVRALPGFWLTIRALARSDDDRM